MEDSDPFIEMKEVSNAKSRVLTETQLESISKYLMDMSKLLVASAILGYFIPGYAGDVSVVSSLFDTFFAGLTFILGVVILRSVRRSDI